MSAKEFILNLLVCIGLGLLCCTFLIYPYETFVYFERIVKGVGELP